MSTERAELYMCRPPEGLRVPILVRQSVIEDDIPTEDEVRQSRGPVGNVSRGVEEVDTGGNMQEGAGEDTVGDLGEISTAEIQGQDPTC